MASRGKGSRWAPEWKTFQDPVSGATVRQLTDYKGHSSHFYFTNPCWYADLQKMLFISDRENCTNLFSIDLGSGEITQLTGLGPGEEGIGGLNVSPLGDQAIYYHGDTLMALDLASLDERALYTRPEGYVGGGTNVTADGRYVCTGHFKDLSDQFHVDLGHGYVGFREIWEARPHSQIVKVALDGSGSEVAFEEDYWLGHLNTSPRHAELMTYCHEGPWNLVENRIWGLNLESGETWQVRPNAPDEAIGHEYWMVDGEHIGYHGRTPDGPVYGSIRYDNTDQIEAPFTYGSTHFHSLTLDLIVGDGSRADPYLLLWRFRDGAFEGPKVLAWHRGSFHTQRVHVHPSFSPDGQYVVYTADPQGYGQVFTVDVREFDALPDRSSI
jgi:oligogalacturonide lyase